MPDVTNKPTGSDGANTPKADTPQSFGTNPETLSVFFSPEEIAPTGDPAKAVDDKGDGSTPPKTGDPAQGTTPKQDGSATDGKEQEPQQRYAGKYETPEALEAGYNSLVTHKATLEAENKAMRQREAELLAKLKGIESGREQTGPTPGTASPKPSAEVDAAKKRLEEMLGPDGIKDFELVYGTPVNQSVDDELRREIDNLKLDRMKEQFYKMRPQAAEPTVVKAVDDLFAELTEKMADPMYMMGLVTDAAIGRMLPELIDSGVMSKLKRMSETDKQRLLAQHVVVDAPAVGGGGPAASEGDPKRTTQRETFFGDMPHMMR